MFEQHPLRLARRARSVHDAEEVIRSGPETAQLCRGRIGCASLFELTERDSPAAARRKYVGYLFDRILKNQGLMLPSLSTQFDGNPQLTELTIPSLQIDDAPNQSVQSPHTPHT